MKPLQQILIFCFAVFFIAFSSSGCGDSSKAGQSRKVIATVNKEPILASELQKDIAIRTRQEPLAKVTPQMEQEQLDLLIDKKLIIQEAVHQGLARDEKFVNTIQTFWEQTLVREFLDSKKKEFAGRLSVTEDEIRSYYTRLGKRMTFLVLKCPDKSSAERVYGQWKQEGKIDPSVWEIVGPVTYAEINSDVLRQAFDAAVNDVKLWEEPPLYYLVMVKERQEIPQKPLDALRPSIERDILVMKEQRLLDGWLKSQRAQADIKILKP